MNITFFSAKKYDIASFESADNSAGHQFTFFEVQLNEHSVALAKNSEVICVFVNDRLNAKVLEVLSEGKTKLVALRCAGFNNVDVEAARRYGIRLVRVPEYSPNAVAEHVLALLLTLYRSTHKAYNRVKEGNFSLVGLAGEEIFGKTIGVIGKGKIGAIVADIFLGFGCRTLIYDPKATKLSDSDRAEYVSLETLYQESDIITLHCPLNDGTRHIINRNSIAQMKNNVTIINTSRGGLINTLDVYHGLKEKEIGFLAIDVYEEEENMFFEDMSTEIIMDDLFMRLTTFPNVLITGHQGFFTHRALSNIAETTLQNVSEFFTKGKAVNEIN